MTRRRRAGPIRRRGRDDELWIAPAQPQLDGAGRQLPGDLGGRDLERVEQHQPDRSVEWGGKPLRERAGLIAPGFGGDRELLAEAINMRFKFHGTSMASLWHHVKCHIGVRGCHSAKPGF